MYHYVYKLEHIETGEFYIGSRSSQKHPTLDNYLGSMRTWNPDKTKLKKIILKEDFIDRESAISFESQEISNNIKNFLNRNYHIPYVGFHTVGTVTVKDKNGDIFQVSLDDQRYLSGELVGITKGIAIVKDKNGNTFHVSTEDPRYLSGDLVGSTKGMLPVRDKNNNILHVSLNDQRYLSGELSHISKGLVSVKDENGNTSQVPTDDHRYLNGELKPIWFGRKHTQESKNRMSESSKGKGLKEENSQFGTCWITLNGVNKKIKKEEINNYLEIGWVKGRVIKNI